MQEYVLTWDSKGIEMSEKEKEKEKPDFVSSGMLSMLEF